MVDYVIIYVGACWLQFICSIGIAVWLIAELQEAWQQNVVPSHRDHPIMILELHGSYQNHLSFRRKVCVVGDALSVEAKHEEKSDNKFVSRQFSRKYTLPKGCDAAMVSSNLSSDGILV